MESCSGFTTKRLGGVMCEEEGSEFGKGLVICLVKFAEHFENPMIKRYHNSRYFYDKLGGDKAKLQHYSRDLRNDVDYFERYEMAVMRKCHTEYTEDQAIQTGLSNMLEWWANGATDHLYEIEVPEAWKRRKLGKKVKELQDLGLEIGHGFTGKTWESGHWKKMFQLTREIYLLVDKEIGLEPDEGRF
jgi:hypothetical protein